MGAKKQTTMLKRAKSTVVHLVRWADGANQNSFIPSAGLTEPIKTVSSRPPG
ncbi:hypothetical protein SCODD09_00073 [Streptococcus constellatus]|nr:hypothetical protein SCODD09_00073 [Streptococcus constellatus]